MTAPLPPRLDPAVVSASVPLRHIPSAAVLAAAFREPTAYPELAPHLERLLLELPPQIVLGFAHRHRLSAAVLRQAYAVCSAAARLRNPALEEALDGLA